MQSPQYLKLREDLQNLLLYMPELKDVELKEFCSELDNVLDGMCQELRG